jgi:alpha-tubulin suppressor-like RCC1 family protein
MMNESLENIQDNSDQSKIKQIALGNHCLMVLYENGSVARFLPNMDSQDEEFLRFESIPQLTEVSHIAAGTNSFFFLRKDGTIWASGDINLFIETRNSESEPKPIEELTDVCHISANYQHAIVVKDDGSAWAFGNNEKSQLGIGKYSSKEQLTKLRFANYDLKNPPGVYQAFAGKNGSLFIMLDGTVWACGSNSFSELGIGLYNKYIIPYPILGLTDICQIATADHHTLFLKTNGQVFVSGKLSIRKPGQINKLDSVTPNEIPGLTDIVQVAAAGSHSFLLRKDGIVFAFGSDYEGVLGLGKRNIVAKSPVELPRLFDIKQIATTKDVTLFLRNDGHILATGNLKFLGLKNAYKMPIDLSCPDKELEIVAKTVFFYHKSLEQDPTQDQINATHLTQAAMERARQSEEEFKQETADKQIDEKIHPKESSSSCSVM